MALKEELSISPFTLESLTSFRITQQIGEHSHLQFEAIVHEDQVEACGKIENMANITVSLSSGEVLFCGYLEYKELIPGQNENLLCVQAVSYSALLDSKPLSRSFQDTSVVYEELMKQVLDQTGEYTDKKIEFSYLADKKNTDEFVMQYQETDWEFLKRMASRTCTPLVVWNHLESVSFYAGLPKGDEVKIEEHLLQKNNSMIQERNQTYYCFNLELDHRVKLGDTICFQGKSYAITEAETYYDQEVLRHSLTACDPKDVKSIRLYNQKICGLILKGEVLKSEADKVEVHIKEIDKEKPEKPYQIKYMTVYLNNGDVGWYFMPEEKDIIYLRFPTISEADIFAYGAERSEEEPEELDPKIKYIRTKEGKEIRFYEKGIVITTKEEDFKIVIDEDNGIVIQSKKSIQMKAEEDIVLQSEKKIALQAKEKISIKAKSCGMELSSEIKVDGDVKVN